MSYNLSNIERTLLSAYLDGEISAEERIEAERLLMRSEGARAYLNEIRAVHALSGSALVVPSVLESAGTSFAAKLSGTAIEAAAEKAVYSKAVALGSWSIAGAVGAAAAVVGVTLAVTNSSEPLVQRTPVPGTPKPARANQQNQSQPPAIDLDTTNLLISPMTPADLFAFAVDGTLPIDSDRGRYITVAPEGSASMALELHAEAPEDLSDHLPSLDAPALAMLDSIQRVVRTSLLQYSNERIALRADLQSLRLGVIRSFEQVAPHMPMEIRERLDRSRTQIAQVQRAFNKGNEAPPFREGETQVGSWKQGGPVPYVLVAFDGADDRQPRFQAPDERIVFRFNEPAVMIDQQTLVALQRMVPAPPPVPAFVEMESSREALNISPVGVRPRTKQKRYSVHVNQQEGEENVEHVIGTPPDNLRLPMLNPVDIGTRFSRQPVDHDSVMVRMRDALDRANESVRRADSIMQQMKNELVRRADSIKQHRNRDLEQNRIYNHVDPNGRMNMNNIRLNGGSVSIEGSIGVGSSEDQGDE